MEDFYGSHAAQRPTPAATIEVTDSVSAPRLRPLTLTLIALAALLVCSTHAAIASANTVPAAAIGYLCLTLVMFGCAAAFWTRARAARGTLYVRWSFISAAALAASIGYAPSCTQAFLNTTPARQFQTACFNASEALFMLATVLFFAGVASSVVIVDVLQALLFTVLRFNLIYSPVTRDHFNVHHLLIGQLMALFLFLVAIVARLGAASRAESNFLRTLSCFLALRLLAFFFANQVSYTWLHYEHCSLWDVPGEALLAAFAVYLFYSSHAARTEALESAPFRAPSILVRSLMPAFLALVNLMLGLFLLRVSFPLSAAAISMSLVCYMARTVLLQAHSVREQALLESRNEQLEGLAARDPLTGIGNRRSLAEAYSRLQADPGGQPLSLLLMDIDHFKQANDLHGHLHGDDVLVTLASKLESLVSRVTGSHCARFGGDEFALLLVKVAPEHAFALGEELRVRFNARAFEAQNVEVSLSIGIASLNTAHDLPLESLVAHADRALYRAKLMGRNRVEVQPVCEPGKIAEDPLAPSIPMELQQIPG